MEPLDVVASTYLACLLDVVREYTGATPTSRPLSANGPDQDTSDIPFATLVRFGEERVWGSSLFVSDEESLRTLAAGDVDDPTDWLGELNNQLVGRLKNRLLCRSVSLHVLPSIVVAGFVKDRGPAAGWVVEWAGGRMTACLGVTVAPGVSLAATDDTIEAAPEGSLILY